MCPGVAAFDQPLSDGLVNKPLTPRMYFISILQLFTVNTFTVLSGRRGILVHETLI
jgi:hypothetical protein